MGDAKFDVHRIDDTAAGFLDGTGAFCFGSSGMAKQAKEIFTEPERPIWRDRTLRAALPAVCMVAVIIWFR